MFSLTIKKNHQSSTSGKLCEGNPPVTYESPHKGTVMWKAFPCHDVIIGNHSDTRSYIDRGPRLCSNLSKHISFSLPLAKVKFLIKWQAGSEIRTPWLHFSTILMKQVNVMSTSISKRGNGCLPNTFKHINGFDLLIRVVSYKLFVDSCDFLPIFHIVFHWQWSLMFVIMWFKKLEFLS